MHLMHLIGPIFRHIMKGFSSQQYPPCSMGELSEKRSKFGGMCTVCEAVCNNNEMYYHGFTNHGSINTLEIITPANFKLLGTHFCGTTVASALLLH